MILFIPRSLCALKRIAAKVELARYGATQGIRIALASGVFRAEATDGHRAMIVQGLIPSEDPPWPGFKDLPDGACEAVILPRDLERACKVGDDFLRSRVDTFGIATMGNDVALGLGSELVTARTVEGRFPNIGQVIPRTRPLFTFSVDPKTLAETLLAMAELLPEAARAVRPRKRASRRPRNPRRPTPRPLRPKTSAPRKARKRRRPRRARRGRKSSRPCTRRPKRSIRAWCCSSGSVISTSCITTMPRSLLPFSA